MAPRSQKLCDAAAARSREPDGRVGSSGNTKKPRSPEQSQWQREEQRHAELVAQELAELKECTFQPSVKRFVPPLQRRSMGDSGSYLKPQQQQDSNGTMAVEDCVEKAVGSERIVIKGLSKHLQLQQKVARRKEEALQREREAFAVKDVGRYRGAADGMTIVKPFSFSQ
jgi:hypothetical protein